MANDIRLAKEFLSVNLEGWTGGWTNGVPVFSPSLDSAGVTLMNKVLDAHVEDDAVYRVTDLRTYAPAVILYSAVTPSRWNAYVKLQKDFIKYLRKTQYREPCVEGMDIAYDKMIKYLRSGDQGDLNEFRAVCDAIDTQYAMPSGQE